MKVNFLSLVALATVLTLHSCGEKQDAEQAEVSEASEIEEKEASAAATMFAIDPATSVLEWRGYKRYVNDEHKGTIAINTGELTVEEGSITAGSFEISVSKMTVLDEGMADEDKTKLIGHLTSGNFFNTEKYPAAKFVIESVSPYTAPATEEKTEVAEGKAAWKTENPTHFVKGNLTIMDSTRSITFPAAVTLAADKVTADAKFAIDRSWWGISYGTEGDARDKVISKDVNISVHIEAPAKQ